MATHPLIEKSPASAYVDESRYERIDGQLVPRPVPGKVHAQVQANLVLLLREKAKKLGGKALPEWSVTRPETREWPEPDYLTPDITFALSPVRTTKNGHLLPPAFLAIEVASPHQEDLFRKAQLYAAWGVAHVWIINPQTRECFEYHGGNQLTIVQEELRAGDVGLRLDDLFDGVD